MSDNTKATATSGGQKPERSWGEISLIAVLVALFVLPATWFLAAYGVPYFLPDAEAGLRMATKNANRFVKTRSKEIENHTFKDTSRYLYQDDVRKDEINPTNWFLTAMEAADNVRDDRRMRNAVIARAADRDEAVPQAEVLGNQSDWNTVREIRVPTRITVDPNDQITPYFRRGYKTNADGTPFQASRTQYDRTVLMQERYANVRGPVPAVGNVNELIGRLCDETGCRAGFALGTDSVLCVGPGFHEGGNLQAWHNGLLILDQVRTSYDFADGSGKFRLRILPDRPEQGATFATQVCSAHPGALVVKNPGRSSTN